MYNFSAFQSKSPDLQNICTGATRFVSKTINELLRIPEVSNAINLLPEKEKQERKKRCRYIEL